MITANTTYYMNTYTGAVDTKEGWAHTDESGVTHDPVSKGEVVEVAKDEGGDWVAV
jgi:hypothetical protein